MGLLNLAEVHRLRELATPDNLKNCGVAYSLSLTYFPALCDMAEKYLETRARSFSSGERVRYSLSSDKDKGYGICGSDGFMIVLGQGELYRGICEQLIGRLNAVTV